MTARASFAYYRFHSGTGLSLAHILPWFLFLASLAIPLQTESMLSGKRDSSLMPKYCKSANMACFCYASIPISPITHLSSLEMGAMIASNISHSSPLLSRLGKKIYLLCFRKLFSNLFLQLSCHQKKRLAAQANRQTPVRCS